ncbi:Stk1 family PASTA domain-containing Ser/Thr kinase [Rhizomonospora bruguierae]|uniref:Stk1 family PASTA domain-containing Ser/Thr kinase n=1 Tax=Rhizomonospora bruguierae TaxID=1581705 RepID=UPI001BCAF387|nr:Stk1 family PASTA domain-containing Ser/Thr kinase [Micromonospora sp. NBRC 107566]
MTAQARLLGGRYQVGELLGYGGMAEVHRGRDLRLGRDVAIKMLRTDLARDATFQMRFRREAQNAASLNHPAIVAVYDTGEERAPTGEALPYIVMEFVNGRTLKEVLAAEGRLMPRRALELIADICAALEFSHRHGIIHRDIKPGNVMLTQTGQVKVMDFGIARALASGATTMTQTSAVIGTAQYLSPEQARGEAVDARSDVYAAGCVLFELLCGHPPFVGDSPVSVAYQHVREDPRAPSEINRDVTPDVDAVVLKALAKNPLNRYQSAGEMRADALRAATGRPVLATPVLREDETVAVGAPVRPMGGATRTIPAARGGGGQKGRGSTWAIAIIAVLGVLAAVALVAGLIVANRDKTEKVAVPNVVDQTVDAAKSTLDQQGLTAVTDGTDKSPTCKKNTVTDQSPVGQQQVNKGTEVHLTVCAGPDAVKIPDLAGTTKDLADKQLSGLGLKPKFIAIDSDQPKDQVIKVLRAGETVSYGTEVEVQISKNNLVAVKNVVGRTEEEARIILEEQGFTVRVKDGNTVPPDQAGMVQAQDPRSGLFDPSKKTITLLVTRPLAETPPPTDEPTDPPTA